MLGTQRLPVPSLAFDAVHCANCRIDWQSDGGVLLLEVNRVLRPGGFFIWSATPVYREGEEDKRLWEGEGDGGQHGRQGQGRLTGLRVHESAGMGRGGHGARCGHEGSYRLVRLVQRCM